MQPTPWARCAAFVSPRDERLELTLSALCIVCLVRVLSRVSWRVVSRVSCCVRMWTQGVLHLLCLRGHTEAVRWLLSRKLFSDINATNAHGDTALHYASRKGHRQIVDLLLAHGASPAHQSEFGTPPQVAGEFQQKDVASLLSGLARDQDAVGIWSLPPEVLVHLLSYLGTAEDLCAVSMACRAFAVVGRDESLWRPLGHPSWEQHHARTEEGWKGAYMTWLRAAAKRYRNKNASRFVHAPVAQEGQPAPTYSCIVKILLAGDHGVGKSSLLLRYADNTFSDQHISTIGVDFKIHMCDVSGELIKAQIWDTAGPERFRTITASYYRGANAIAIPYDITDRGSFEGVFRWWEEKQKYAHENAAVMLVGCKRDLADQRVVTEEEGRYDSAFVIIIIPIISVSITITVILMFACAGYSSKRARRTTHTRPTGSGRRSWACCSPNARPRRARACEMRSTCWWSTSPAAGAPWAEWRRPPTSPPRPRSPSTAVPPAPAPTPVRSRRPRRRPSAVFSSS